MIFEYYGPALILEAKYKLQEIIAWRDILAGQPVQDQRFLMADAIGQAMTDFRSFYTAVREYLLSRTPVFSGSLRGSIWVQAELLVYQGSLYFFGDIFNQIIQNNSFLEEILFLAVIATQQDPLDDRAYAAPLDAGSRGHLAPMVKASGGGVYSGPINSLEIWATAKGLSPYMMRNFIAQRGTKPVSNFIDTWASGAVLSASYPHFVPAPMVFHGVFLDRQSGIIQDNGSHVL